MGRMHSGAQGKSGSKKPLKRVPSWAPYQEKEVERLIVKFAKVGKSSSEIGLILRDSYGIHSVEALLQKKVGAILRENNLSKKLPEDIMALIKKMIALNQHFEKNKHDETAKRGFQLTSSKIRRLTKYYKATGKLAADWELDLDKLKLYLE